MRRIFRAAGLAAVVAFYAVTSFAAPAAAQAVSQPALATYVAHESASIAETNLGVNYPRPGQPAAAYPFSQLFGHAVAAIGAAQAQPEPGRTAVIGEHSLDGLVATYVAPATIDAQQDCLASAVYFEARGETLEGQLAVATVVLNRAASGRFPPDVCAVVTQPAQFSFVRHGRIPEANRNCDAWHRALAIAEVAREQLVPCIPSSVLWYHAAYVSPSWGQRLTKAAQIGLHIFYS